MREKIQKRNRTFLSNLSVRLRKWGFAETLSFQQIANNLLSEGTVPVPANRPFALRLCRITFSGVIAPGAPPRRGRKHHIPEPSKCVKKKILRISTKPKMDILMRISALGKKQERTK